MVLIIIIDAKASPSSPYLLQTFKIFLQTEHSTNDKKTSYGHETNWKYELAYLQHQKNQCIYNLESVDQTLRLCWYLDSRASYLYLYLLSFLSYSLSSFKKNVIRDKSKTLWDQDRNCYEYPNNSRLFSKTYHFKEICNKYAKKKRYESTLLAWTYGDNLSIFSLLTKRSILF